MDITIKNQLLKDFENYMTSFYASFNRFSLDDFSGFSSTILNYYVSNKFIMLNEKKEAAFYLTTLYNKGIGNRITDDHLQLISEMIANDSSIDFNVVKRLFN